jgi:hypothetical protein
MICGWWGVVLVGLMFYVEQGFSLGIADFLLREVGITKDNTITDSLRD